jgi:hypothetical protein
MNAQPNPLGFLSVHVNRWQMGCRQIQRDVPFGQVAFQTRLNAQGGFLPLRISNAIGEHIFWAWSHLRVRAGKFADGG